MRQWPLSSVNSSESMRCAFQTYCTQTMGRRRSHRRYEPRWSNWVLNRPTAARESATIIRILSRCSARPNIGRISLLTVLLVLRRLATGHWHLCGGITKSTDTVRSNSSHRFSTEIPPSHLLFYPPCIGQAIKNPKRLRNLTFPLAFEVPIWDCKA